MNILLVNLDQAKFYPPIIQSYIQSKKVNCYLSQSRKKEIEKVIKTNNLSPDNTIIHGRVPGPQVTKVFKELERRGFKIINNSSTLELVSNKYKTQIFAEKHNIPCVKSFKINKKDINRIVTLVSKYNTLVLKPIYSQGRGLYVKKVSFRNSKKEIERLVQDIPGREIVVQEYIPYKKLIRTIVVRFKILREATTYDEPKDDWKASVCLNPFIKKYDQKNSELFDLAEKTSRDFNAEIAFIDFFEDINGEIILNEINTACGLIIHEDVTKIAIHTYIGDYLIQKVRDLRNN